MAPTAIIDTRDLRMAGGAMLGLAAVRGAVPAAASVGVPCPLRALTGIPCPLCGMTTSVTATVGLDVAEAAAANPLGIAAVAVAIVLLLRPRLRHLSLPFWLVAVTLGGAWIYQLARFGVL